MARTKKSNLQRLIEEETKVLALGELVRKSLEEKIKLTPSNFPERDILNDVLLSLRQRILDGRTTIATLSQLPMIMFTVMARIKNEQREKG